MAFKVTWKPVLQALALRDYHPDYGENVIMICVNPQPEFYAERTALMAEYSKQLIQMQAATQKATILKGEAKEETSEQAAQLNQAFSVWAEQTFLPGMQGWFARLWSFGAEQFTVDDLDEYEKVDPHLLAWLKRCSMEMIEEHRQGRKKN